MKAAFATWNRRIAPLFDSAGQVLLVEPRQGAAIEELASFADDSPVHKVLCLIEWQVGTLVCGAVSQPVQAMLAAHNIQVVDYIAGYLEEVVQAWLNGRLEQEVFCMPGCRPKGGGHARGMRQIFQEASMMKQKGGGRGAGGGQGQRQGGQGRRQGGGQQGPGRMGNAKAAGPVGVCVCPNCGQTAPHQRGLPCIASKCPQCGATMTRQA